MAITSYDVTCDKKKLKKHDPKSPYLTGDRVQLLSRVTEKRFIHKKTLDFVSSFPLAVNIYKANSDDFKAMKRTKRKIKKSVLTLPNKPSQPQICTVSDMNDSEYYSQSNDKSKPRIKKRASIKNVRKPRTLNKDFDCFDRNARYCSQLNIDFDSSFTDLIKNYKGDGKRVSNLSRQKGFKSSYHPAANKENENDIQPHDVWAVLRNMNRFQFNPSPPMSEECDVAPKTKKKKKKKKELQKHIGCKDARVIETCRTEEFAFISSYQADDSSRSLSQSSFDRITVISKQDEFSKICKDYEERFLKTGCIIESNKSKNHEDKKKINKRNKYKGKLKAFEFNKPPEENNVKLAALKHDVLHLQTENDPKNQANCKADDVIPTLANIDDSRLMCYSELTSVCSNNNNKIDIENVTEYSSDPAKESFFYSDNLQSSKAENAPKERYKLKGEKSSEIAPNGRLPTLNGISRVIFGKGREATANPIAVKRPEVPKRKTRLVTTMPSACMMPKLTQAEIRRRLASMRFPLVVLGKDQVSSTIEVNNYEPPQFDGLDQHVWPFMRGWSGMEQSGEIVTMQKVESKDSNDQLFKIYDNFYPDRNLNEVRKNNNEVATNKNLNYKSKRNIANDLSANKNIVEMKRIVVNPEINSKSHSKKQKSMIQFKDKMLNLLYRKVSDRNVVDENNVSCKGIKQSRIRTAANKVDACTETQIKSFVSSPGRPKSLRSPVLSQSTKYNRTGSGYYPWARAKWASDFIENVIKKIKNGSYYSNEQKCMNHITETSIQTEPSLNQENIYENISAPKVTIKRKQFDVPKNIPGFESSVPGLEIKILNMNEIAVKHRETNIMMQFDVTVPTATKQIISPKTSFSLIPIDVTESHTKIFKCKTTILNAMLPAQLCSILPKMLSLFDSDIKPNACPAICAAFIEGTESHLSTISEITPVESLNISTESLSTVTSFNYLSPAIKEMFGGMFSKTRRVPKNQIVPKRTPVISNDFVLTLELLPKISFDHTNILTYRIRRFIPVFTDVKEKTLDISKTILPVLLEKPHSKCTALELYSYKNKRLVPAFKPYDFFTTIRDILINQTFVIHSHILLNFDTMQIPYNNQIQNVHNMKIPDEIREKNVTVAVSSMKIDNHSHEDKRDQCLIIQNASPSKCVQYIKRSTNYDFEEKNQPSVTEIKIPNTKNKRRGFYRLYRKCKSVTNIPAAEKCINTQLNKIQNLEDFFQILGSKIMISSVFDGYAARKILSSVSEMKNWITEINPKQALLILLLTNKKDTPNLVRFRPILLQGIAVNRITRATELDMEIEVIERENLNKLSQYEGISYLTSSTQNQDSLLEELYWIAKTTASDYQRPFDESSERLLKSLLEKRKKLNPSYLRVMARYVGLGLLKSPTKK